MTETNGKTGAWIGTEYLLHAAKLKMYNYDGQGRIHCISSVVITRRVLQQLIEKIDLNDDQLEQEILPF